MGDDQEFEEFIKFLSLTKRLMDRTVEQYVYYYKKLDLSMLSSQDYCNQFVQDHKNNSIVRGMLLNLLEFKGLSKTINMPPKKTGSMKKRIIRDISHEEIDVVRNYLYRISFKKGLIFDLAYQGALRRFEIPTIKLNSFKWIEWLDHPDDPCHLIVQGKGDKERTVLINPETAERIFNHYNKKYEFKDMDGIRTFANSQSLIFGKKLSEWYVWDVIHSGSKKAIGRGIRPHELRHCRATELERMGVAIRDIKNYLGHSNLATTEIYLHTSEKESIENIGNILKNG